MSHNNNNNYNNNNNSIHYVYRAIMLHSAVTWAHSNPWHRFSHCTVEFAVYSRIRYLPQKIAELPLFVCLYIYNRLNVLGGPKD